MCVCVYVYIWMYLCMCIYMYVYTVYVSMYVCGGVTSSFVNHLANLILIELITPCLCLLDEVTEAS